MAIINTISKHAYLTLYIVILIAADVLRADCVVFTKPDSADWTMEQYQDRITDNVWITRKHNQSLFNIAQEDSYSGSNGSPGGTQWANTATAHANSNSYTSFVSMHGGSTQSIIGDTVSLYLPDDDLYFDVIFTSFSGGNSGGGFSYIRLSVASDIECLVFTKPDSADWTLEQYQDRITDNVWITRKHNQSLFNIAQEDGYSGSNGSPMGTLWANTATAYADSSAYTNFASMHGGSTQSLIGDTVSLYLPDDDLYFDVIFTSFSGGNNGGGFSYIRTSINTLDIDPINVPVSFSVSNNYPNPFNPVTKFTYQLPVASSVSFQVFDLRGNMVIDHNEGMKSPGRHQITLTASKLSSGTYFCVFSAGSFQKTQKVMLIK
jgi:hypothetical protein